MWVFFVCVCPDLYQALIVMVYYVQYVLVEALPRVQYGKNNMRV